MNCWIELAFFIYLNTNKVKYTTDLQTTICFGTSNWKKPQTLFFTVHVALFALIQAIDVAKFCSWGLKFHTLVVRSKSILSRNL